MLFRSNRATRAGSVGHGTHWHTGFEQRHGGGRCQRGALGQGLVAGLAVAAGTFVGPSPAWAAPTLRVDARAS